MAKHLDRWMSTISGPLEDNVPDDLMALALELDRKLVGDALDGGDLLESMEPFARLNQASA